MTVAFDIKTSHASGLVHPMIFGHPSPLAFIGWAHALARSAWKDGFGRPPTSAKELNARLEQVKVLIGVQDFHLHGKLHRNGRWGFVWPRDGQRQTSKGLITGSGDNPRFDAHWHLLVSLPNDLEDAIPDAPFMAWLESWRLGRGISGGVNLAGGTQPVQPWRGEVTEIRDFLGDSWIMTPHVLPIDMFSESELERASTLEAWVEALHGSPYRSRHVSPTVLGHQLLEAPVGDRPNSRQGLRHAYADSLLGLVHWKNARGAEDIPGKQWRLTVTHSGNAQDKGRYPAFLAQTD